MESCAKALNSEHIHSFKPSRVASAQKDNYHRCDLC